MSSFSAEISSSIEAVVQLELLLVDLLEEMQERALETSRAETLHDLDRNSMGTFGLSGSCMEQTELCSSLRGLMRGISSMGGDDPGKELVLKF